MEKAHRHIMVKLGFIITVFLTLALLFVYWQPFSVAHGLSYADALALLAPWLMCLALPLVYAIARVAIYRFLTGVYRESAHKIPFDHEDLRLQALKNQLQNTFEQALLALIVYLSLLSLLPSQHIGALYLSCVCFLLGRALFFLGYMHRGLARALGFALTFYPQILLLTFAVWSAVTRLA